MTTAAIYQFQKKQEAEFFCSACGADRGCDCNAPAVERLAEIKEQTRVRARKSMQKKRQQNQQTVSANTDEMPTEAEADESYQETLYDQACLLLESMAGSTRQRFFAYLKEKYHVVED